MTKKNGKKWMNNAKRPKSLFIDNFGSEGARAMVLEKNERKIGALSNALVKSKNCRLIPESAANLYRCDLVQL
jgi:hypothetical protein